LSLQKLWNNKLYYKAASCWYFYWESSVLRFYLSATLLGCRRSDDSCACD